MRRGWAWGLSAVVLVALADAGRSRADGAEKGTKAKPAAKKSNSWWNPFASESDDKKGAAKKETEEIEKNIAKKGVLPVKPIPVVDEAAAERAREQKILLRRLEVCDKLQEVAMRTNDTRLLRRAEELDDWAKKVYARKADPSRGGITRQIAGTEDQQ